MALREDQFDVKETKVIKHSAPVVKCLQVSYFTWVPSKWVTTIKYWNLHSWEVEDICEIMF